jgi:hypothetical protein
MLTRIRGFVRRGAMIASASRIAAIAAAISRRRRGAQPQPHRKAAPIRTNEEAAIC